MTLSSGRKLGPYEILDPIGAGGMGEVYKAKDTRLDRTVAIKVLPSHLAGDSGLRKRFEQEARVVSSLNHPHICILHDVGREDGVDFIVMEYLEGETLAERLKKGALPLDEVLRYGIQITDALDKAHRRGIVHRDLKPANVMLTPSGPKLLDFGLAKMGMADPASAASSLSGLPTAAKALTAEGAIIGTFQYMAPEQLEAQEVDARTDIFALGALLYEMATGRKAFEGKSQASLIGAIMKSDPPPVSQLQSTAPPALDHVIRRCLAKDPEDRWQAARDINRELSWIAEGGMQSEPTAPVERASAPRERMAWVAGLVLASAVSMLATWAFVRPDPLPVRRLAMNVSLGAAAGRGTRPGLSPDGRSVAYVAIVDGVRLLHIRSFEQFEARVLPGTEGAYNPFFSPDGEWVGFFTGPGRADGKLKRVSVRGGPPLTLADARLPQGSWGDDGTIVFGHAGGHSGQDDTLYRIPAAGGAPEPITELDPEQGERRHGWPDVLPGGESVVFSISTGDDLSYREARVAVLSLSTGEYRTVIEQGHHARYAESGHLVYMLNGVLMAVPFDLGRLETTAPPVPILQGVRGTIQVGHVQFDVSPDGTLAYVSGVADQGFQRLLVWVDRDGREEPLSAEPRSYNYPRISPDGTRVAIDVRDDDQDIWIWDLTRETLTRLTFDAFRNQYPVWTPDGARVLFSAEPDGALNLFWKAADGTGAEERLTESPNDQHAMSISPDGQRVVFRETTPGGGFDLYVLSLDERVVEPALTSSFRELNGEVSPDGRWLAYQSDESGRFEIYVRPFPNIDEGRWQVSTGGGSAPLWGPDTRELFYLARDGRLMSVPVQTGAGFQAGSAEVQLETAYRTRFGRPYDISPDGTRFLVIQERALAEDPVGELAIQIVLNWFEELERLAPPN